MGSSNRLLHAQTASVLFDPDKALTQYMHHVWKVADGLPQNSIATVLQAADGHLWIGTSEGLVRFNGIDFVTFDRSNTQAFEQGHTISAALEDRAGTLWIGTRGGGLVRYRQGRFERYAAQQGISGQVVNALAQDDAGRVWVGTSDAGLFACRDGSCRPYTVKNGLPGNMVRAVLAHDGVVWVGTDQGLARMRDGRVHVFGTAEGLADEFVMALYADREGRVWVSTRGGLGRFEGALFVPCPVEEGWPAEVVWSLWQDEAGSLWMGLDQSGLVRYHDGRFEHFTPEDGLSHGRVLTLFRDREGSLWIGTEAGGLNRLRDGTFTMYTTREGLSNNIVRTVYEDAEGNLWIGTEGGVDQLRDGVIRPFATEEELKSTFVTSVYGDRHGSLWVGTLGGGLSRFSDGSSPRYSVKDGLPSDAVFSLHGGSDGSLWIGTDNGLGNFYEGRFITYTTEDGLSSNFITALHEDRQGDLWVGTYDAGLNRLSDGQVTTFSKEDGLGSDVISALYEDAEGTLWVGTYEGGLARFKDGVFTAYTWRHGLFDDKIYQIFEDDQGYFWMGCNKGVFKVQKAELEAVAAGERDTVTSVVYSEDDGLKSREINGGVQPAGWKGADGRLWFPTLGGLAMVDPVVLRRNETSPTVVIEDVRIDKVSLTERTAVELAAGTEYIEFAYAALSLVDPKAIRYRYRLEGYEEAWSAPTTRRVMTYTHLAPGRYTFRVIAMNNDGVWNDAGAAFSFYLRPFFYQSPWFWLLSAIGSVGLVFFVYALRIRRLTAQQRRLEQNVETRTHDLRVAKEQIEAQANALRGSLREKEVLLREIHHRVKNNLQIISSLLHLQSQKVSDAQTLDLFRECRDRIYAMSIIHERLYRSDNLAQFDFGTYLNHITDQLFRSYNVWEGIALDVESEVGELDIDQAIPCGLIVNELVSNALKHAFPDRRHGWVRVAFFAEEGIYRLVVEDNGVGMPPDFTMTRSRSLGLKLVAALVEKLQGALHIEGYKAGRLAGTKFDIVFPAAPLVPAPALPATESTPIA